VQKEGAQDEKGNRLPSALRNFRRFFLHDRHQIIHPGFPP
jgi:hypothetical protein